MKIFLLLLILFSFMQSAFLPLNLVLVLIVARSLAIDDKKNLLMGFSGGLALSFLTQTNLGYWPIILVLAAKLTATITKLPISFNPLIIFLSGGIIISIVATLNGFLIDEELQILTHILEAVLVVPAFYLVRAWEERFVVKGAIKLKV